MNNYEKDIYPDYGLNITWEYKWSGGRTEMYGYNVNCTDGD